MKLTAVENVTVPVQVVLGEARLTLQQLDQLGEGSIVELDGIAGEPVEFVASGQPVARGEVVIIDENFGIRITEMLPDAGGQYE
jgi:flagellar motor switch protein FliN/FliY